MNTLESKLKRVDVFTNSKNESFERTNRIALFNQVNQSREEGGPEDQLKCTTLAMRDKANVQNSFREKNLNCEYVMDSSILINLKILMKGSFYEQGK